jgi:hypothetical protein
MRVWPPGCCGRSRAGSGSGTSWPAWPSRGHWRRGAGPTCTAGSWRRCWPNRTRLRDPARLAHHAEGAGDGAAVLEHAPVAARRAAGLGAHREAAAQYARALRFADGLAPVALAELLEGHSYECYLTDQLDDAAASRRRALACWRARKDRGREGDTLRWLSRLAWLQGRNAEAGRAGREAVELLEGLAPGAELAMAYSNLAQLGMLAHDVDQAVAWGERAIALAERLGQTEILVHALNNVGTAQLQAGRRGGPPWTGAWPWPRPTAWRSTSPGPTPTWSRSPSSSATTGSPPAPPTPGSATAPNATWTPGVWPCWPTRPEPTSSRDAGPRPPAPPSRCSATPRPRRSAGSTPWPSSAGSGPAGATPGSGHPGRGPRPGRRDRAPAGRRRRGRGGPLAGPRLPL